MSAISVSWLNVSWGAVYFETNYGLMQHSYSEITNKLLGALDSEYNVLDMPTVFEIVSVLERTPITTEILEATRLGKVINECRRRTSNEALARRAKHLVRHWRDMMIAPPSAPSSTVVSPSAPPPTIPQQNGTNARSSNPATAVAPLNANRVATPTISVSPALSTSSSAGGRGNGGGGGSSSSSSSSNVYDSKVSPSSSLSPGGDPKVESVPKTHVANKRLRKNAASPVAGEPPIKVAKVNGATFAERVGEMSEDSTDYDFVVATVAATTTTTTTTRPRDPKPQPFVTAEEDDHDEPSSSSRSAARSAAAAAAETVPLQEPPLPKKRSRKKGGKRKPQADDIVKEKLVALSKTVRVKTTEELVAELKSRSENRLSTAAAIASSAATGGGGCCLSNAATAKPSLSNNVHGAAAAESSLLRTDLERLDPEARVEREIAAILAKLPPVNVDEIVWDSMSESSAPATPRPPVTDDEVERYLRQPWPDVNGCVTHVAAATASEDDNGGAFREWHEMVARRTTNDALIHILPYSIVD